MRAVKCYNLAKDSGYAVDAAVSGEQALRKLREIKPNLIILDMMMPGLSGLYASPGASGTTGLSA